jgi:hypothetical protein
MEREELVLGSTESVSRLGRFGVNILHQVWDRHVATVSMWSSCAIVTYRRLRYNLQRLGTTWMLILSTEYVVSQGRSVPGQVKYSSSMRGNVGGGTDKLSEVGQPAAGFRAGLVSRAL